MTVLTTAKISKLWTLILTIALFTVIFTGPYQATLNSRSGRDYASYHYAVKASVQGENPYVVTTLEQLAREEGHRKRVHPFFYPPTAILSVLWTAPMGLLSGYHAFFWFNQLCLVATLWGIRQWRTVSWNTILGCTLLLWPVMDSMKMGQINLLVGFLVLLALRYRSGVALAAASMIKMSPALFFFGWIVERRWKAVWSCVLGCLGLSILTLPWVSFTDQVLFYTEVLPQFSSGAYHGLSVPINIPANHSIPDLYNQLFPGVKQTILSDVAKRLASLTTVSLLAYLLWLFHCFKSDESKLFVSLALVPLMLVTPVYTYEHHLALLLIPLVLCFETFETRGVLFRFVAWLILAFGGQPLFSLRWLQREIGFGGWWFQESKFFFVLLVGVYCVWYAQQIEREHDSGCQ